MMNKELIVITKIKPIYQNTSFIGREPVMVQIALIAKFTYRGVKSVIRYNTNTICGDEIKNAIMLEEEFR